MKRKPTLPEQLAAARVERDEYRHGHYARFARYWVETQKEMDRLEQRVKRLELKVASAEQPSLFGG